MADEDLARLMQQLEVEEQDSDETIRQVLRLGAALNLGEPTDVIVEEALPPRLDIRKIDRDNVYFELEWVLQRTNICPERWQSRDPIIINKPFCLESQEVYVGFWANNQTSDINVFFRRFGGVLFENRDYNIDVFIIAGDRQFSATMQYGREAYACIFKRATFELLTQPYITFKFHFRMLKDHPFYPKIPHYSDEIFYKEYREKCCDITLVVADTTEHVDYVTDGRKVQKLTAHRVILSIYSRVFRRKFLENENEPILELDDISFEMLKYLVDFMYSGQISEPINDAHFDEIFYAANLYEVHAIIKLLQVHLISSNNHKRRSSFVIDNNLVPVIEILNEM